jgi:hypothetical protein
MSELTEAEYKEILIRIQKIWDLVEPNNSRCPNINELNKLCTIALDYEDKQIWDKYKKKWWETLFKDLKE